MKTIFLILTVCLTAPAFSQQKTSKLTYGIKAGVTMSNLSPDMTDINGNKNDFRYKNGFTFGGRIQLEAGKHFILLPELSLAGKGAKIFLDYGNGFVDNSPALSTYAELIINVLKQFSFKKGKFMLGGGPALAFNTDEYSQELSKTDFGVNVLATYQIPVGFSFELNFNKGLKKQRGNDYSLSTKDLTTSVFGFCVGYLF